MDQTLRKRAEIVFTALLLAVLVTLYIVSLSFPPRPRALPMIVNLAGLFLVGFQLITLIITPAEKFKKQRPLNWHAISLGFLSMTAYVAATYFFGIVFSSFIVIYGCGKAFGAKDTKKLIILSIASAIAIYLIFEFALDINLFKGILFS